MRALLLPVKDLKNAKKRLIGVLTPEERFALAEAMLADTIRAVQGVRLAQKIFVVTNYEPAMRIAEKFSRPIISFIDLPGAYPGLGAEERGQAEAIARNILEMSRLRVPTISVISGEGGSGGALALAVSDRVLILENALYFVITPESCAAIMWRDSSKAETAAVALKITATDLKELGIIDEIVPEPEAGAHTDYEEAARLLNVVLDRQLVMLTNEPVKDLLESRYKKFRNMGQYFDFG